MNYWLLVIPLISAFIGWLIARISVAVLFQRILPQRQADLAKQVGRTVSNEFSFADIEKKISDPANAKKILPLVEEHVDDFLRNKLKAKMPVIGMFIGDKTINSMKEIFLKEIEEMFPRILTQFAGNLQQELDVESMVTKRITSIPTAQMEKMAAPVLKYYLVIAAIMGFCVGLVNLAIFLLAS
jgi:uncharacterized membrane protein YheB (UPF0754 family)